VGRSRSGGVIEQYQTEIPQPRPIRRRIDIHHGRCRDCGRSVRGRHPTQTSEATGAAGSQLGPRALAMIAQLNKGLGLSFAKTQAVMRGAFGIIISRAGAWHGVLRASRAAKPTYQALAERVREAPAVTVDETGWKVDGVLRWLWVFATTQVIVYRIAPGRGYEQAASVLSEGYAGVIIRDGWAPYLRFKHATHQTCIAHLRRRCREMVADSDRGQARVPHALARILADALAIRDQRNQEALDAEQVAEARKALDERTDKLLAGDVHHPPNVRLLKHIATQRDHLFTFLQIPGLDATNWRAEQGVRPIVVTRKVFGGNREWTGAHAQEVLCSLLQTCRLQQQDAQAILVELLRSPIPLIASIALNGDRQTRGP
jgi:transposase